MPRPTLPYRLDVWDAPAPAGGARTAFLVAETGRAARDVRRTRALEAGRSQLTFTVAPDYPHLSALAPQAGVVRLTEFVPTSATAYTTRISEYRVLSRRRTVERGVGPYELVCVPLEEDLLDQDLYRTVGSGGLPSWAYSATDRTPTEVLTDLKDRLVALGITWIDVGTVTPTTPVSFTLARTATPRAIVAALVEALAAKGVTAEFQFTLATDLSEYRLELVSAVAGAMAPLRARTDANAIAIDYSEDALEQATTVIPFGADGIDLRELQFRAASIDGATGWITVEALDESDAVIVAVDDQFNGMRLFRESTGRSFAITDSSASPQRIRVAVADLASGLASGERLSLRATEDNAGLRRYVTHENGEVPIEVVSTLTSPARIKTRKLDFLGGGNWCEAANQLRDWTAERSQFLEQLDGGSLNEQAGTFELDSAPTNTPAVGDWILFCASPFGSATFAYAAPVTVTGYNAGTLTISFERRYAGTQLATGTVTVLPDARLYRPVGTPMWITGSAVTDNELTVDALTGPSFTAGDVLEVWQRCQGTRLVELTDPVALAATRRKVATVELPDCTGATNRVTNADLAAWAGGSGDPPDGYSIVNVAGTVTRSRETGATKTRYGGKSWKLDFALGGSAEILSPAIPIHPVVGAEQVSIAVALLFERFTGATPLVVTLYRVTAGGTRTALGEPVRVYPPDTTLDIAPELKPALDVWYDAVITNQSVAGLRAEQLQIGVARPVEANSPACTVYVDAMLLLQREGLPEDPEGGVRWIFGSDATRLLTAGQELLLSRATPLLRFEGRLLDVFRLDALEYAPFELALGRQVTLEIPPLSLTRTVRLVAISEDLDDARVAQVSLERVRPDVARLLADQLATPPLEPTTLLPPPALEAFLEVSAVWTDTTYVITYVGGPMLTLTINGAPATLGASPLTVTRNPANGPAKEYVLEASAGPGKVKRATVQVQPQQYVPTGAPTISTLTISNVSAPGDGTGSFDLDITVADMPVGTTYNWSAVAIPGGSGFGDPIAGGSDSDTGLVIGDFPVTGITGCALAGGSQLQVQVDAINASVVIATKSVTITT